MHVIDNNVLMVLPFLHHSSQGPLYAAAKGLAVGGMAAIMELRYPGIVLNATMLTMGTAFSLFAAFQARLIDVNDQFRSGVMMVTGGFMITMLGTWLLSLAGIHIPGIMSGGPVSIFAQFDFQSLFDVQRGA